MSNRRRSDPRGGRSITEALNAMDGLRLPGGCDVCDAYQTLTSPAYGLTGVSVITVHHDDWCPVLAHHEGRSL